jgi:hypothetical protein
MVCGLSLDAPHDAAAKQFNRQGAKAAKKFYFLKNKVLGALGVLAVRSL